MVPGGCPGCRGRLDGDLVIPDWADARVSVTPLPSGIVRVGPHPIGAAGIGRVLLAGATMLVDPMTPHSVPSLEVSDASTAEPWLRDLLGDTVADQVLAAETRGPEEGGSRETATAVIGPELSQAARLGMLLWLALDGPWVLPPDVLALEMVVGSTALLPRLDDEEVVAEAIAAMANPVSDLLLATVRGVPGGHSVPLDLARRAARAVSTTVPLSDPAFERLIQSVAEDPDPSTRRGHHGFDAAQLLLACTPVGATHAGTDDVLYSGSATADWRRNSPGSVSRDEDAIFWSVELRGSAAEVSVVVPRPSTSGMSATVSPEGLLKALVPFARLTADLGSSVSLHTAAWPLAIAEARLAGHDGSSTRRGRLLLEGVAAATVAAALRHGSLVVDVHDAGVRHAHLLDDPLAAAARRWTARGVCAARLAIARRDSSVEQAAVAALSRGAQLWRATDSSTSRPGLGELRAQHCTGWLALIRRAPAASRTIAEPDLPADSVPFPTPISRDDEEHPLLQPTEAELAFADIEQ